MPFGKYSQDIAPRRLNLRVSVNINLDLIQKLFDPNPKTRIDLTSVKKHPWYNG